MATQTLPRQTSQKMFLGEFVTLSLVRDGLVSTVCLFLHRKHVWRGIFDSVEGLGFFLFVQMLLQSLNFVYTKCVILSQLWIVGQPRRNLLLVTLYYLFSVNYWYRSALFFSYTGWFWQQDQSFQTHFQRRWEQTILLCSGQNIKFAALT